MQNKNDYLCQVLFNSTESQDSTIRLSTTKGPLNHVFMYFLYYEGLHAFYQFVAIACEIQTN